MKSHYPFSRLRTRCSYDHIGGISIDPETPALTRKRFADRVAGDRKWLRKYPGIYTPDMQQRIGLELTPYELCMIGSLNRPLVPGPHIPIAFSLLEVDFQEINALRRAHTFEDSYFGLVPIPYGNLSDYTKDYLTSGEAMRGLDSRDCQFLLSLPSVNKEGEFLWPQVIRVFHRSDRSERYEELTDSLDAKKLQPKGQFRMPGNLRDLVEVFEFMYRIEYKPMQPGKSEGFDYPTNGGGQSTYGKGSDSGTQLRIAA